MKYIILYQDTKPYEVNVKQILKLYAVKFLSSRIVNLLETDHLKSQVGLNKLNQSLCKTLDI